MTFKRYNKYEVMKLDDIDKFLLPYEKHWLAAIVRSLQAGRRGEGKEPCNSYVVVNEDESYAEQVWQLIQRHCEQERLDRPSVDDEVLIGVLKSLCSRLDADKDLAEIKAIDYALDMFRHRLVRPDRESFLTDLRLLEERKTSPEWIATKYLALIPDIEEAKKQLLKEIERHTYKIKRLPFQATKIRFIRIPEPNWQALLEEG